MDDLKMLRSFAQPMPPKSPPPPPPAYVSRLLKPLPAFSASAELRELAAIVSRDIYQHNPNVKWSDVVELDDAKRLLKEADRYEKELTDMVAQRDSELGECREKLMRLLSVVSVCQAQSKF